MNVTRWVCLSTAMLGFTACSSEASPPPGDSNMSVGGGGMGGAAAVAGVAGVSGSGGFVGGAGGGVSGAGGGVSGAGGASGAGGVAGAGGGMVGSTITPCPMASMIPEATLDMFPVCMQCADAHCVPNAAVPADSADLLAACDANSKCVPDAYALVTGSFLAKTCTSLLNAEGRCISVCVPAVSEQVDRLPQADCAVGEKCAPCYNPIDGMDTGACSVACDTGPTQPAVVFAECGMGRGKCVPMELVPPELAMSVPVDTCTGGTVCAPTEKVLDLTYRFPSCMVGGLAALLEPNGACVPAYLVKPDQVALIGPIGTPSPPCAADEYCAPCTNPTLMGAPRTGACD